MKNLLAFCSARHHRWFDKPHDHVWKKIDPLGTPARKSDLWGMTQATELKSRLICFVSFFCFCLIWFFTSTKQSFSYAGRFFLGLTSTKLGEMCLAQGPQRSDAGEARTRYPSVSSQALYHWATALPPSFARTNTKFGIKIFEIDFVIENKWYLTFWPLPRGRGKKNDVARPIHASNSHIKFG